MYKSFYAKNALVFNPNSGSSMTLAAMNSSPSVPVNHLMNVEFSADGVLSVPSGGELKIDGKPYDFSSLSAGKSYKIDVTFDSVCSDVIDLLFGKTPNAMKTDVTTWDKVSGEQIIQDIKTFHAKVFDSNVKKEEEEEFIPDVNCLF